MPRVPGGGLATTLAPSKLQISTLTKGIKSPDGQVRAGIAFGSDLRNLLSRVLGGLFLRHLRVMLGLALLFFFTVRGLLRLTVGMQLCLLLRVQLAVMIGVVLFEHFFFQLLPLFLGVLLHLRLFL